MAHWPVRMPMTVLGRPSLVGGGVLPEQARRPKIRLASISVAVAFSGGTLMVVVLLFTVSGPRIWLPPSSTNPVLPRRVAAPRSVLAPQGGPPSSPVSPMTITPLTPEMVVGPLTVVGQTRSPVPLVGVSGP